MVNWREDIEFFYVLFILVSSIIVFFTLYDYKGLLIAGGVVAIAVLVEVAVAFALFESDKAVTNWEKLGKNEP
jgi:hypothetical protein